LPETFGGHGFQTLKGKKGIVRGRNHHRKMLGGKRDRKPLKKLAKDARITAEERETPMEALEC